MGKLVRDRIPELIRADGRTASVRVLDDAEFVSSLRAKLQEEVDELLTADPQEWLDEAADVLEVMLALLQQHGVGLGRLLEAREMKRRTRGGFEERFWWESHEPDPRRADPA